MFDDAHRELSRLFDALGSALHRWGRELAPIASRRGFRRLRIGPVPTRLPRPRVRRPMRLPHVLPPPFRGGRPRTLLDRGGTSPFAEAVESSAARLAALLRQRLLDLQRTLRGVPQRLDDSRERTR
jgi:hypothetical protein